MTLGMLSASAYGAGAIAFGIFALLLITAWRGRLQGALMLVAVGATMVWCAAQAVYGLTGSVGFLQLQLVEVTRDAAWLVFLLRLLSPARRSPDPATVTAVTDGQTGDSPRSVAHAKSSWFGVVTTLWTTVIVLIVATFALALADALMQPAQERPLAQSKYVMTSFLLLAVAGLTLIEQLYRNCRHEHRWALKYLLLGLGTLFAYDLYLYSAGLLFGSLDPFVWAARGLVQVLALPLLILAARRNPQWSLDVFVSRQVAFHTAAFVGCGVYLVVMAAVGYWIRDFGGTWGGFAQALFLSGACVVLALLMFSAQLRAKFRVFLAKHFYRNKYDYREEWLNFAGKLAAGGPRQPLIERIVQAVSAIVGSPGGVLFARASRADTYTPIAAVGMPLPKSIAEPKDGPLASFLAAEEWVVALDRDEVRSLESRFGLVLPDWLGQLPDPWLVVPFLHAEVLIAFLVVRRPPRGTALTFEDLDLLKTLGRQSASYMALWRTTEALSEARQFEAFNRLSAYVVHDLKNVSGQLNLILGNARRHRDSPGFVDDALATVENAVTRMNKMLAQLKTDLTGSMPLRARVVRLEEVAARASTARGGEAPIPSFEAKDQDLWVQCDASRLQDVIEHLLRNAQEATLPEGEVSMSVSRADGRARLEVRDNGSGMDANFIAERLFRPFDTTKGNAGMGVGAHQARELVRSLGGSMAVNSEPGHGTTFVIELPLLRSEADAQSGAQDQQRDPEPEAGTSTADFMS